MHTHWCVLIEISMEIGMLNFWLGLLVTALMKETYFIKLFFFIKVRFLYQCSDHLSHSKNFTSLFPLIFLSKHISLYALGRIRWILDIIWPLNQHFKLKNQRNWLNQVWMWKFWNVMNCILLHWYKHLTLAPAILPKIYLSS